MDDAQKNVYAILLAGGTGTRLWPVSRELYPKQLVKLIGQDSLVQSTIKRLAPVIDMQNVRVVCGEQHFHETARHMEDVGLQPAGRLICEPAGRNTAPAILLAALHVLAHDTDALLCVFPADHVIGDLELFHERLRAAIRLAARGYVATFGIKPGYAETGYGYVEGGARVAEGALAVKRFIEKPDLATAEKYVAAGNFFWNSGMFVFKAAVILEEFKTWQPQLLAKMQAIFVPDKPPALRHYQQLPDISIDYAIMEKTARGVVLPSDFGWSDIGSWKSLYDFLEKDENHNVIDGDVIVQKTRHCLILGRDRLIASNRLCNVVVVETPDSLFVSDLEHSREVKSIVAELKARGRKEYHQHRTIYHPWGISKLLEQNDHYKASELTVYPGFALQLPEDAAVTWHLLVVGGQANVSGGSRKKMLRSGESFTCPAAEPMQIENPAQEALYLIRIALR